MPTFPSTSSFAPTVTVTGGGDAAQWGPCPPGSLMERQKLGLDLRGPSAVLVATEACGGGAPGGCRDSGCGCGTCAAGADALAGPYQQWLRTGPARVNPATGNLVPGAGRARGEPLDFSHEFGQRQLPPNRRPSGRTLVGFPRAHRRRQSPPVPLPPPAHHTAA
jgi:hypothetical protein